MNQKNQFTTRQIVKEILAEMAEMGIFDRLNVLCFVFRLRLRRYPHQTLNVCLLLVVLALGLYLLAACSSLPLDAMTHFVITPTAEPTSTPETCTVQTEVPAGYLNLRTGAGTQYPMIRVLDEGEVLTIIERGAWLTVMDTRGNKGYINARYCR